ncbi:MAG: PilZ domain-containing protein [Alphaproteobacteria bacterium HGW-Alphaproteobacteria-16]|nr:MAG: PilZ domain-containing protein [Alphaproteobacteria bacterium HGW-Alphaproteobacteria-16]
MDQFPSNPLDAQLNDDPSSQRNANRDSLFLSAQLRVDGGPETTVRVRNLSAGGLMAEYAATAVSGAPVRVDVRGVGWVSGRIAWSAEGRIGIAFDRDIDPKLARKPVGTAQHTPRIAKPLIY